jgi:transposase-like protein
MLKQSDNIALLSEGGEMNCQTCNGTTKKFGKDRNGFQRFRCVACKKTFTEPHSKPLGDMRLPIDKAISVIQHLVEGCSIRSTELKASHTVAFTELPSYVRWRASTSYPNRETIILS